MPERDEQVKKRINILSWVGSLFIVASTLTIAIFMGQRMAGTYVFSFITLTCLIFCAVYIRSRWRSTSPGRAIMYIMGSFGLVGLVVCSALFLGTEYPGRDQIRMATYLCVALAVYNVSLTMSSYQWQSKRDRKRQGSDEQ